MPAQVVPLTTVVADVTIAGVLSIGSMAAPVKRFLLRPFVRHAAALSMDKPKLEETATDENEAKVEEIRALLEKGFRVGRFGKRP